MTKFTGFVYKPTRLLNKHKPTYLKRPGMFDTRNKTLSRSTLTSLNCPLWNNSKGNNYKVFLCQKNIMFIFHSD